MFETWLRRAVVAVVIVVLSFGMGGTASAKGLPDLITIDGAEVITPLRVISDGTRRGIYEGLFLAQQEVVGPVEATNLFLLTSWYEVDGEDEAFSQIIYSPGEDGGPGLVYRLGIVGGSAGEDGRWYRAEEAGAAAFMATFGHAGVDLARRSRGRIEERPSAPVWDAPAIGPVGPVWGATFLVLIVLAGAGGWWIGRRSRRAS